MLVTRRTRVRVHSLSDAGGLCRLCNNITPQTAVIHIPVDN